ncbi:MAG TPA: DUF1361 domain-containing protein [Bacteroidetes bacterium]|nr:DUF1361 domain-containing protein [Bacteroidota bacterium]
MSLPSRPLLFALLSGWCLALLAARVAATGSWLFVFLGWNLVLALLPLGASALLARWHRRRAPRLALLAVGAAWLLVLPNAPYILTDLFHFRHRPPVPTWFDLALLLSFAGTGLLAGYLSLAEVHRVVAERIGARVAWAGAVGVLFLSAFGIYLGRYLRYNSWEVLTAPGPLFSDVLAPLLDPMGHPRAVAVTLVFGGLLTLGYLAMHAAAAYAREPAR